MKLSKPTLADAAIFSPDGAWLITGGQDAVRFFDAHTGTFDGETNAHAAYIRGLSITPDGELLATAGEDTTAAIIDLRRRAIRHRLTGHSQIVLSVKFLPAHDAVATASLDATVKIWNYRTGELARTLRCPTNGSFRRVDLVGQNLLAAAFTFVSQHGRGGLALWNLDDFSEAGMILVDRSGPIPMAPTQDDRHVFAARSGDGAVVKLDVKSKQQIAVLGDCDDAWSTSVSPDGKTTAVGAYRRLDPYDTASRERITSLRGFDEAVLAVAWSPDGKFLAAADGYLVDGNAPRPRVRVLESATWSECAKLTCEVASALRFSPDGKLLAAATAPCQRSGPNAVILWDTHTWQERSRLPYIPEQAPCVISFSPDGKFVATGIADYYDVRPGMVMLWRLADAKLVAQLHGHTNGIYSIAFIDDGKTLVSGGADRTMRVWDVATGALSRTIAVDSSAVAALAPLPGEKRIVAGGNDGAISIWETESWRRLAQFQLGENQELTGMAISPTSSVLVAARRNRVDQGDGGVSFWSFAHQPHALDPHDDSEVPANLAALNDLDKLRTAGEIDQPLYYRARRLLSAEPDDLDDYDRKCRSLVEKAVAGEITWTDLPARLESVERSPVPNELVIGEGIKRGRKEFVARLWQEAEANDTPAHGREAIVTLKHILRIDPAHAEAKQLLAKIEGYYPPKTQTNSLGMALVEIRPGRFLMGSTLTESGRGPGEMIHAVKISKEFWLGAHEVTRGQFAKFVEATGYRTEGEKEDESRAAQLEAAVPQVMSRNWRNPGFEQEDEHPVVYVSWNDAQAFCRWLSEKEGKTYRLPSEAEWEFACRADGWTPWPWGETSDAGQGWCNVAGSEARGELGEAAAFGFDDGAAHTNRVGAYRASKWGLFDMTGNVREWCHDYGGAYPALLVENPRGPERGIARVIRGGSWRSSPAACRAAARGQNRDTFSADDLGFRVVVE